MTGYIGQHAMKAPVSSQPRAFQSASGVHTPYVKLHMLLHWHLHCIFISAPNLRRRTRRYFYIPARKEHRGIGGLFFDDLEAEGAPYDVQAYVEVSPACTAVKQSIKALLSTP